MLASMMLATSAAWLEVSMARNRFDDNLREHLRASQAADSALALCVRDWRAGIAPAHPAWHTAPAQRTAFDGLAAYEPVPSWPGSARPPHCVIEAVGPDSLEGPESDEQARAYRITARGFGALESTQAWLELTIARESGRERQAWRRILSAPTTN
ncbi:pilus assembly PilX family protein [Trinickia diaoshuihuensis]|uniref:pilus assembly PilX family protein n=1 Tax=Trinickia diaoshuihuensis TaxID=2292265 RepID=UPI0013C311F2|nr:pilus assembly protein [Trinickia diaoshuihuensis]